MRSVSAIVGGSICLVAPGHKIYDRLYHALSYPNPAATINWITRQPRNDVPAWLSCADEFPDESVRIPRGAVKELREVLTQCDATPVWLDRRSQGKVIPQVDVPLRDYQLQARDKLRQAVQGLAMMPCGGGKTRCGVALIGAIARSALVIVPTVDILDQWCEQIRALLGSEPGVVSDGQAVWRDITVALPKTLSTLAMSTDDGPWNHFGVCIVDESHRVGAVTYQRLLPYIPAKYRFGLTATERDDGLNPLMYWSFQSQVVDVDAQFLVKKGYLVQAEIQEVETDFDFDFSGPDRKRIPELHRRLVCDKARNHLIAELAAREGAAGHSVLVLSNHKAHCRKLAHLICAAGTKAVALVGSMTSHERKLDTGGLVKHTKKDRRQVVEALRDGSERVLVATSLADEGLDIPRLSRVILAFPGGSHRATQQQLGRAMRPFEGKYPVLYDLVDRKVDTLRRRAAERRRVYRKLGLI
jgi:superfamily II DNA or RNA helicase